MSDEFNNDVVEAEEKQIEEAEVEFKEPELTQTQKDNIAVMDYLVGLVIGTCVDVNKVRYTRVMGGVVYHTLWEDKVIAGCFIPFPVKGDVV